MKKSVLLLSADFAPLKVVTRQRAVRLILNGKADAVAERDFMLRSSSFEMADPAVVLLRTRPNVPYRKTPAPTRRAVLARDGHRCAYCGKTGADTIDHIIPTARGGEHTFVNLVAACRKCNAAKGHKTLAELGWKLNVTPRPPGQQFWISLAAKTTDVDPLWEPFLSS